MPTSAQQLRLHHVGIVVDDIEEKRRYYEEALGYTARTGVIHDPVQTAYVQFLQLGNGETFIELVAPDGPESKLARASKKGLPLNHLCYATKAMEATLAHLSTKGSLVFKAPVPAVAFEGRRIAWVMGPDGLLVELVEDGGWGAL
jgi:methylmalonyl-CoA/ethylmalonyl-CoA epimerase